MKAPARGAIGGAAFLLAAACVLALLAASAEAQSETPGSSKRFADALGQAPEKARARHSPVEQEQDAVAAGGKLFELHCAECHGRKASGTRRGPSLLGEEMQQAPPGAIFWVLTNGVVRHGMPVWSKLPEPERWQLVTFLKSFRAQTASKEGAL